MNIYHYDPTTFEYLAADTADENPLVDGEFLIPEHATSNPPPNAINGKARIYAGGIWTQVTDKRGTIYWDDSRVSYTITELGVSPPEGSFASDPGPTLEEAKTEKRNEINNAADEALSYIINLYPTSEVNSWPVQIEEANAWTADNDAATPFLDGLLARRPTKTKTVLAQTIIANSDEYKVVSADIFGQRQELDDAVDDATTIAEVQAITVVIV